MKLIFIFARSRRLIILSALVTFLHCSFTTKAQICSNPTNQIYGLTADGAIYTINVMSANVGSVVKNTTYSGNSVNRANGLAYNNTNGKFYYYKRNYGSSPEEFVSYDPALATVTILASSTCWNEVHTGAITANGQAYYTVDVDGDLNYYNILTNTWTYICSTFKDQFGNDVTSVIKSQSAGDIAFDGLGNLWFVTSNSSNYGVYKLSAPMPTTPVGSLTVKRIIDPATATPSGNMIAGIAFNPSGQIFMATKFDDRLYRLENNLTTTLMGTFNVTDVGNDLTSCAFPLSVLPVKWLSYSATLVNNSRVRLDWEVAEQGNSGYSVEYSSDGVQWKEISFIQSVNEQSETQRYTYYHDNPNPGKNYYRIKMSEASKNESFSETRVITVKALSHSISIWPNPAADFIRVSAKTENGNHLVKARLFDLAGKMEFEKQLQAGETTLDIRSLNKGTYVINLLYSDGTNSNQKFIKQ